MALMLTSSYTKRFGGDMPLFLHLFSFIHYVTEQGRAQLIIQTVYILQLNSAVTDSLPWGSVVMPFQPYFPIT
jgi:hypothetical protein